MMKKFNLNNDNTLFLGSAREINSLFRNLEKREIAFCVFSSYPRFNSSHNYGLLVRNYDECREEYLLAPEMSVINADMAVDILLHDI